MLSSTSGAPPALVMERVAGALAPEANVMASAGNAAIGCCGSPAAPSATVSVPAFDVSTSEAVRAPDARGVNVTTMATEAPWAGGNAVASAAAALVASTAKSAGSTPSIE